MTAAQSNLQIEPPPSSRGVTQAISNVLREFRGAYAELIDHNEDLTAQRQLLDEDRRRIKAPETRSPDAPANNPDDNDSVSRPDSLRPAAKPTRKAGGGSTAEQFRKLRRDAKRKPRRQAGSADGI